MFTPVAWSSFTENPSLDQRISLCPNGAEKHLSEMQCSALCLPVGFKAGGKEGKFFLNFRATESSVYRMESMSLPEREDSFSPLSHPVCGVQRKVVLGQRE